MSYLHCPACHRAYNIAVQPHCPSCPVQATPVDPTEDIIAAAESLARAMDRATDAERAAALASVGPMLLRVQPAPPPAPRRERLRDRVIRRAADVLVRREPPKLITDGLTRLRRATSSWLAL